MGLTLFITGCLIRFGSDTIEEFFADRISGTYNFMRSAGSEGNMENFDLAEYIATFAYVLIAVGGFFLVVSLLGCCGGIGKIRCFLIFYAMCVCLLILLEIAVVILVLGFPSKVRSAVKEPLLQSLRQEFVGIHSSEPSSAGWNFLMVVFRCCGVENSSDFDGANNWDRKYTVPGRPINGTLTITSPPITVLLQTPVACCRTIGSFPEVRLPEDNNITCAIRPNSDNNNMNTGCLDELIDSVHSNYTYILGMTGVVVLSEGCLDELIDSVHSHYTYILGMTGVVVLSEIIMLLMVVCLLQAIKRRRNFDKELQRMFRDE
ncbi:hypothetical protein EGW08_012123 [Elysia chlorotica]|uniref:Uncharacterized protein n=1 Tax=Elysia chlorotica TaxID=188477 RepID=A0A3S1BC66_ELYCH|nr:hypothetical protein EGW08_012123 [Elysia chlorotica]